MSPNRDPLTPLGGEKCPLFLLRHPQQQNQIGFDSQPVPLLPSHAMVPFTREERRGQREGFTCIVIEGVVVSLIVTGTA